MGRHKEDRIYRSPTLWAFNAKRARFRLKPERESDQGREHLLVIEHDQIPDMVKALQRAYAYGSMRLYRPEFDRLICEHLYRAAPY
jgi:hypothetical protein